MRRAGLLRGNAAARERGAIRDRLRLVAAACLAQADVMETDDIHEQVHQATRRPDDVRELVGPPVLRRLSVDDD
ncbi:hypothetical protein [Actinoplanes auranticolor]|uniref:Uncharacterized protein n=1 Tax=Actinoplanes auranticolor TaxID=47988 RepID=A0A919VK55_9ACTN|nr:hypothetical protein [Actinoplanes auranticolor]GIM66200.1 hypothetical protein Aau02nite_22110 [Actinoplanes auranticolor]